MSCALVTGVQTCALPICNVADKGPAAARLVERNIGQETFSFIQTELPSPLDSYGLWYFCLHIGDAYISAEISRPNLIVANTIRDYSERIMLCRPGEMAGLRPRIVVPEDFAQIDKPAIVRKK